MLVAADTETGAPAKRASLAAVRAAAARHVGVDTGGTFTDLVTVDGDVRKVPSTPTAPSAAVERALDGVVPDLLAHGTTVATNALLQRRLARVALVTTRGFADVIEIARQARPSLYDQRVDRPPALVPRSLRFEVSGRLDGRGRVLEACDGEPPAALRDAIAAVQSTPSPSASSTPISIPPTSARSRPRCVPRFPCAARTRSRRSSASTSAR